MIDIDHFKSFNDTYGHFIPDKLLRLVGLTFEVEHQEPGLQHALRGEKLAIVVPKMPILQAIIITDNIR